MGGGSSKAAAQIPKVKCGVVMYSPVSLPSDQLARYLVDVVAPERQPDVMLGFDETENVVYMLYRYGQTVGSGYHTSGTSITVAHYKQLAREYTFCDPATLPQLRSLASKSYEEYLHTLEPAPPASQPRRPIIPEDVLVAHAQEIESDRLSRYRGRYHYRRHY
jgi:hypothetical protein